MMEFMAGNDIQSRAHAELISTGEAGTIKGLFCKAVEKRNSRRAYHAQFREDIFKVAFIGPGSRRVTVLIEARQWGSIISGKTQRAIHENPLSIGNMHQNLFNRPFALRTRAAQFFL